MRTRTLVLALAAGVSTFLVVAATVSELLLPLIEFSVLVGLPVGLLCGAGVALFVVRRADIPGPVGHAATAFGAFGVVSLLTFAAGLALGERVSQVLLVGAALGVLAGLGAAVQRARRKRRNPPG